MTSTDSIDSMASDDRYLPHMGMTVAQAYAQMKADDEKADASYPKVIPPCPSWCSYTPGHGYESTEHDLVTHVRYHESHPQGDVTIVQEEKNCRGDVALAPVKLTIWGTSGSEDLSGTSARALAAELLARAEQLDAITATS